MRTWETLREQVLSGGWGYCAEAYSRTPPPKAKPFTEVAKDSEDEDTPNTAESEG